MLEDCWLGLTTNDWQRITLMFSFILTGAFAAIYVLLPLTIAAARDKPRFLTMLGNKRVIAIIPFSVAALVLSWLDISSPAASHMHSFVYLNLVVAVGTYIAVRPVTYPQFIALIPADRLKGAMKAMILIKASITLSVGMTAFAMYGLYFGSHCSTLPEMIS